MGKEIDRVISYVYGSAKKAIGPKRVSRRKVRKAGKEVKHGYAQDVLPVKAIRNGIIQTKKRLLYKNIRDFTYQFC